MKKLLLSVAVAALMITGSYTTAYAKPAENIVKDNKTEKKVEAQNILIQTSMGNITVQLDPEKAPVTVNNFLKYVNAGLYDNTIFHRVIKDFMIQGGGFNVEMKEHDTYAPIKIESNNGLKNKRGTIAMARTQDPNSATSQFFINVVDNDFLNYTAPSIAGYGYTVFGKVTSGMEVADKIALSKTGNKGFHENVPLEPIIIKSVTILK